MEQSETLRTKLSALQSSRAPWAVGLADRFNLQTLPPHADQVLIAAGLYHGIFTIVSPLVSRALVSDTYAKLDRRTRVNWDSRVVAFIQAVFISCKALSVILSDPSRRTATVSERLWGYSPEAGTCQAYAAGYFLWDIYLSSRHLHIAGPTALVHAVCAFLVTMVGFRPFANYYGVNFVLYELSTPFLNIHWALDKFGMTGSDLQLYNGLALMASFFGCRLVWGTFQTYLLTCDMLSAVETGPVPRFLFATYLFANTMLTGLNFYWFSKMIQALRKRFERKVSQE